MVDSAKEQKVLELAREYYNSECKTGKYKVAGKPVIGFWHAKGKWAVLSNWYISDFELDGIKFNCMEQLIMYGKAKVFKNITLANKILTEKNPANIKKYGRMVTGFDERTWQIERDNWTLEGLVAKFCQDGKGEKLLLETGDKLIAECSPYDKIWGIGIDLDYGYDDIDNWGGKNLLGQYLMSVRYGLKKYSEE